MNTASTQAAENTCGTCARWTRHADERMAEHGGCEFRPVGHYTHQASRCLFDPTCWVARK